MTIRTGLSIPVVFLLTACQAKAAPSASLAAAAATPAAVAAPPAATPATPMVTLPDFSVVAEKVVPSVVSIKVVQHAKTSAMDGRGQGADPHDFFRFFQGLPPGFRMPRQGPSEGLGSGYVIESSGLILTNYHVIENADDIEVTLQHGSESRTLKGKVIGKAPEYDVALVKTDEDAKAPALELGDSDATKIGQWVMAVGNPFGLSQTVSVGIVSAKDRINIAPSGRQGLYDFMQTDAAINPGNSGGPLVDMAGHVVGMNTAINAEGSGIGFAIPSNMIRAMLSDLRTKGSFARAWIGVKIQGLNKELAQSYGLSEPRGALVAEVVPDGPGAKAGLKEGDVITTFNGKRIDSSEQLPLWAGMAGAGKKVELGVWRDHHEKNMTVELGAFPDDNGAVAQSGPKGGSNKLGVTLEDVSPDAAQQLGLARGQRGAVVTDVAPDSAAAKAGLREGDVIVGVQGERIDGAATVEKLVSKMKSGEPLRMQVLRNGSKLFMAIRKP